MNKEKEPIAFFTNRKDAEVICVYLDQSERDGRVPMYAHEGQHGVCHPDYLEEQFRLSIEGEYEDLLSELKSIPPTDIEFEVVNDLEIIKSSLHKPDAPIESILVDIPDSGNVSTKAPGKM